MGVWKRLGLGGSIIALGLLGGAAYLWYDWHEQGYALHAAGNFNAAFPRLKHLAELGDPKAQFDVGFMYSHGNGVTQSDEQAANWYLRSAENGNAEGERAIGIFLSVGRGVGKDEAASVRWLKKAAQQNDAAAEMELAHAYLHGAGVEKDDKVGAEWVKSAADQGYVYAYGFLGLLYSQGRGVPKDEVTALTWLKKGAEAGIADTEVRYGIALEFGKGVTPDEKQAVDWYRKAAEQGDENGLLRLGLSYEAGKAIRRNAVLAYLDFNLAAATGNKDAIEARERAAKSLNSSQLKEAQSLSSSWKNGTPLPGSTSLESMAPQDAFSYTELDKPQLYQNTRTLLSSIVKTGTVDYHLILLATKAEETCHVCGGTLSAVAYQRDPEGGWKLAGRYPKIAEIGAWGDIQDQADINTINFVPVTSPDPGIIVLLSGGYMTQGAITTGDDLLFFQPPSLSAPYEGGWRQVGTVQTGFDAGASCEQGIIGKCRSWTGNITYTSTQTGWPSLIVQADGTDVDGNNHVVKAPNHRYEYTGKKYVEVAMAQGRQ